MFVTCFEFEFFGVCWTSSFENYVDFLGGGDSNFMVFMSARLLLPDKKRIKC